MSTPQWNADIITPDDGSVDIAVNGGLVENEQGELGVSVDGESIVINSDGELQANIPTPETVDQVFDGTSTHAQSGVAMAGALADYTPTASLATVATSGAYADLSGTPNLSLKEDAANKKQSIDGTSETDYPSSKAVAQYVGDAITTNSADYISDNGQPFASVSDLPTDPTVVSNNDYAIVLSQGIYYRYKATVSGSTVTWALEYEINTSPLSQAQLNAVNSGITAAKVTTYDGHVADTDIHVTTSDKSAWNAKQDAISDLDTIRSGASAGATAVQPGDLATVATTGAYSDLSGTPSLATVATSGDYDDLLNKPTIPAAQVQSNWTEADNTKPSYIQNKPSIPTVDQTYDASSVNAQSGAAIAGALADYTPTASLATVATSGSYDDLQDKPTIPSPNVFVATYGVTTYQELSAAHTAGKAIFVTNVSGSLSSVMPMTSFSTNPAMVIFTTVIGSVEYSAKIDQGVWSSTSVSLQADWNESNQLAPSYVANKPTVDQVYDSTSTNAQSGTAVAGAIAGVRQVPSTQSSDNGKVLGVTDTSGTLGWVSGGGGGTVDQTYDPTSTNAQSGTAVAGAIASLHLNMFKAKYAAGTSPVHIYDNKYIAFWKDTSSTDNVWWFLCGSYLNQTFYQDTNLLEILEANTPSLVYMGSMFEGCTSLTSVSLFDTSNVTYMGNAFRYCRSLTSVPLFDTSNVTNMGSMFDECRSLTSVPLFDTSKVTDMGQMFYNCLALTSVPLFNTSNVTNMYNTFYACRAVESGALALYTQASTQATPPTSHSGTFTACGRDTVTGAAELAQIPTSWGGTMA